MWTNKMFSPESSWDQSKSPVRDILDITKVLAYSVLFLLPKGTWTVRLNQFRGFDKEFCSCLDSRANKLV